MIERSWIPHGSEIKLDSSGFFEDPFRYDDVLLRFGLGKREAKRSDELQGKACLILLGPPGIGKSTSLKALCEAESTPEERINIDLAEIGDLTDLRDQLFNNAKFLAWRNGHTSLALYLDSYDEGRLSVANLASIFKSRLFVGKASDLKLRIACRTGVWPESLGGQIATYWDSEHVGHYQLAPFRIRDVEAFIEAEANDLDAAELVEEFERRKLGALASVPLTLKLLLKVYREQGHLPDSRVELYQQATRSLCGEQNKDRREADRVGRLDPVERLRLVTHIAGLMRFSGKTHLFIGPYSGAPKGALALYEINTSHSTFRTDEEAVRDVAEYTGFFISDGPQKVRWLHLSFAEFLAAQFLVQHQTFPEQVHALFTHPDDGGLLPHLRETAAWLAASNQEYFDVVSEIEPFLALQDQVVLTAQQQGAILDHVLRRYHTKEYFILDPGIPNVDSLNWPGLTTDLEEWIRDKSKITAARTVAVVIATRTSRVEVIPLLLRIALDASEPIDLREWVVSSIESLGTAADVRQLMPLCYTSLDEDSERFLAFAARRVLFPDDLPLDAFIAAVDADIALLNDAGGSVQIDRRLQRFCWTHFSVGCSAHRLVEGLKWIVSTNTYPGYLQELAERIVETAIDYVDEDEVRRLLARIILDSTPTGFSSGSQTFSFDYVHNLLDAKVDARRKLSLEVAEQYELGYDTNGRDRRPHRLGHTWSLFKGEDVAWMIDQLMCESRDAKQEVWYQFVEQHAGIIGGAASEVILEACWERQHHKLEAIYRKWYAGWLINSSESDKERAFWREQHAYKTKLKPPDPSLAQQIENELEKAQQGDWKAWWKVCECLQRSPSNANAKNYTMRWTQSNLTKARTWETLSDVQKQGVLQAAEAIIQTSKIDVADWLPGNGWTYKACNGARAWVFVLELAEDRIDDISESVWATWAPLFITFPFDSAASARTKLIVYAHQYAPEQIYESLQQSWGQYDYQDLAEALRQIGDAEIAHLLYKTVIALPQGSEVREFTLKYLIEQQTEQAITLVLREVDALLKAQNNNLAWPDLQRIAHVFYHAPDRAWGMIRSRFENNDFFAEKILGFIADKMRWGRADVPDFSEAMLMRFAIRLSQVVPEDSDPVIAEREMYHVTTAHNLSGLRDGLITLLTKRGTCASVDALRAIAEAMPDKDYSYSITQARKQYRQSEPHYLPLHEVLEVVQNPDALPIRSDRELQYAVIRALHRLQAELATQEQASGEDLWNTIPRRLANKFNIKGKMRYPKDEERISDYIVRYLRRDLHSRGVTIAREAEVQRGSETDLHIKVPVSSGGEGQFSEVVQTIIEVKPAWNRDLLTAMESQLAFRYLRESGQQYGVYLSVWFALEEWSEQDPNRASVIKHEPGRIRQQLHEQAERLKSSGFHIEPILLEVC